MNRISKYCPRCDRQFTASSAKLALTLLIEHLKKAHPNYYYQFWLD